MIKIAFFDFDQTLYSHFSSTIPLTATIAINEMHKKGIKIFLCSGRSLCEMQYFDTSSIKIDGMIANNGQIAYDNNNNVIFDYPIDGKLKEEIIKKFNDKSVPIFIHTENSVFANYINDTVTKTQRDINSPVPIVKEYEGENIYMCSAFFSDKENWSELLALKDLANITFWHDGAVDIVPLNINKASGIKGVLDYYNISVDETIAFGDADNDIEMLKYCKYGVAVGNATDEIKKVADYVTDHIEENGIYNACKHYELI